MYFIRNNNSIWFQQIKQSYGLQGYLKESPIVTERITNSYSNVKQSVSLVQTLNTYESTLIQGHDVESAFLQCCFKLRADRQGTKYQYLYDPQKRHLLDPIGSDA